MSEADTRLAPSGPLAVLGLGQRLGMACLRKLQLMGKPPRRFFRDVSAVAADLSATSSRFLGAAPTSATNSPSCTPTGSAPAALGSSNSVAVGEITKADRKEVGPSERLTGGRETRWG